MKAAIIVGATGMGKSTLAKFLTKHVDKSRLIPYDVNGEYFPGVPLPDIDEHLKTVAGLTDCTFIWEEATVFFSNRGSNKIMRKMLVGKRHDHNVHLLLFHSIRSIPFYIYDLINFAFIFHTSDDENLVASKHPKLLAAYKAVHNKPHKFKTVIINP